MSSCRETCVDESMWGRAEKSVCRGFTACRVRALQGRRGETLARKEMRERMAGSTAQGSQRAIRSSYEMLRT